LRLRQEIQALPRRAGLSEAPDFSGLSRQSAERALAQAFAGSPVVDPFREARLTLRASQGVAAAAWLASPDALIGDPSRARAFSERRLAGEPLSRIVGAREFWSFDFSLSPDVLDPRADTETLVEAALAAFAARKNERLRVLDFGVGSGAILAALLSELPVACGIGVDKNPAAAALASENLARLGLASRASVLVSDWGAALDETRFDLIVSNPPYIASADIATLAAEVRDHDPRLALDGGEDGLDAYRALAPDIARRLAPEGGRFFVEIGAGQAWDVQAIFAAAALTEQSVVKDLAGHDRVVCGRVGGRR
jgi:release factor glutamine methyltransferase